MRKIILKAVPFHISTYLRRLPYPRIGCWRDVSISPNLILKLRMYIRRLLYPRIWFFNPRMYIRRYESDFQIRVCISAGKNRLLKAVYFSSVRYRPESDFESHTFLEVLPQVRIGFWNPYICWEYATVLNWLLKCVDVCVLQHMTTINILIIICFYRYNWQHQSFDASIEFNCSVRFYEVIFTSIKISLQKWRANKFLGIYFWFRLNDAFNLKFNTTNNILIIIWCYFFNV